MFEKLKTLFLGKKGQKKEEHMPENEIKAKETKEETKTDVAVEKTEPEKNVGEEGKEKETETKENKEVVEEKEEKKDDELEEPDFAIDIENIATKDFVKEAIKHFVDDAIAPLQAKYEAVVKENEDLKEQIGKEKSEKESIRAKYEDGDFGTQVSKTDISAGKNSSYVSYEEMWNGQKNFD